MDRRFGGCVLSTRTVCDSRDDSNKTRAPSNRSISNSHDEISGEDLGFHDIVEADKDLRGG